MHVNTEYNWKLNERHYGDWQGKSKEAILHEVGEEYFSSVRRGYATSPPFLLEEDSRNPKFDSNYKLISSSFLPLGESLQDTSDRVVDYFYESIAPQLAKGKTILFSAHGNSSRALIGHIEHISHNNIKKVEIGTGMPHLYEFDCCLNIVQHSQLK